MGLLGTRPGARTGPTLLVRPIPGLNVRLAHHRLETRIAGAPLEIGRARGTDEHEAVVRRDGLVGRRSGRVRVVAPAPAAGTRVDVVRLPRESVVANAGSHRFAETMFEVERSAASL